MSAWKIPLLLLLSAPLTFSLLRGHFSVTRDLIFDLESRLTCFWEAFEADDQLRIDVGSTAAHKLHLQLRVTSPSGVLSDWTDGDRHAYATYNLTETGEYEICVHSNQPTRVALRIFAYNEASLVAGMSEYTEIQESGEKLQRSVVTLHEALYQTLHSIRYYNLQSVRDEALQAQNGDYITRYVVLFVASNLIIALLQVYFIRTLFREDNSKIRI